MLLPYIFIDPVGCNTYVQKRVKAEGEVEKVHKLIF